MSEAGQPNLQRTEHPMPGDSQAGIPLGADSVEKYVTVGPPGNWVKTREADDSFSSDAGNGYSFILEDLQCYAEEKETFSRRVYRLETLRTVHKESQWTLNFDPRTTQIRIHSVQRRRGGEIKEHAELGRIRLLQRESRLESLVVRGDLTLLILLEDVRVGDIIDISYTTRYRPPLLPGRFWTTFEIPSFVSVRTFYVSVMFARERPVRWKGLTGNPPSPEIKESDGQIEWTWRAENIVAREPELHVLTWHLMGRWIHVSDCQSWEEVAVNVCRIWNEEFEDEGVTRAAQEIAAGTSTLDQRIERAIRFVQDEVRYLSINEKHGGKVPTPPGKVLAQKFGDCKDKSFLLVHLLRRLGVGARPVLVNTHLRQKVGDFLPSPDAFNHAIVEYERQGRRYWADPTVAMQGGTATTRLGPEFNLGLPIGPGVKNLEPIGPSQAGEGRYELREIFSIDTRGRQSVLTIIVTATGREADQLRWAIAMDGTEAFGAKREAIYKEMDSRFKRIESVQCYDDRDANKIVVTEAYELPEVDQRIEFTIAAHMIRSALAVPREKKRNYPLALPDSRYLVHSVEVESSAWQARFVEPFSARNAMFRFTCDPVQRAGTIVIRCSLQILAESVPPEKIESYVKNVEEVLLHTIWRIWLPEGFASGRRVATKTIALGKTGEVVRQTGTFSKASATASIDEELADVPAGPLLSVPEGAKSLPVKVEAAHEPTVAESETFARRDERPVPAFPAASAQMESGGLNQRRQKARREKLLLALVFVLLTAANGILLLAMPKKQYDPAVVPVINILWTTVLLVAAWRRQNWALYLLSGFLFLSVGFGAISYNSPLYNTNDVASLVKYGMVILFRLGGVGILLWIASLRRGALRS